jgi:hypothetical protein
MLENKEEEEKLSYQEMIKIDTDFKILEKTFDKEI